MNQEPAPEGMSMPKVVDMFLTNRVLCAFLAVMMLTSAYWLNVLFGNLGLIAFLFLVVGVLLHLAVPSLFALVMMGGGLKYSLQAGGIAALLLLILSSGSVYITIVFMLLFVLLPVLAAQAMQRQGLGQAAWMLSIVLFVCLAVGMMVGASPLDLEAFVAQQFKPMFDEMVTKIPTGATEEIAAVHSLQSMMIKVFPGFFIFSLWLIWWSNLLLARKVALKYGFYQGVESDILSFSMPKLLVYVLLAFIAFANMAEGNLQYIAMSGVIVVAAILAVQGVIVTHAWLKSRAMMNTVIVMYVMLFFWSVVIVIFTLIGLLDIWFNFRRKFISATGEK